MAFTHTRSELAGALGLSRPRISQLVGAGTLNGCFQGDGRARRFDLRAVAERLSRELHPGQRLGNGSRSDQAGRAILDSESCDQPRRPLQQDDEMPTTEDDPARYRVARIQKLESEARRLQRQEALDSGTAVLRSSVETEMARVVQSEMAALDAAIREMATTIAAQLHVDAAAVRAILREELRAYRQRRAGELAAAAVGAEQDGLAKDELPHDV